MGAIRSNPYGILIEVEDAMHFKTYYTYYSNGNLKTEKNALNYITTHEYDSYGYLHKTIDPLGNIQEYTNDANGHQLSSTTYRTANGVLVAETSTSTYNNSGQLLTQTDALGHMTTYTYNEVGNQLTQTDANNHTTSFMYDALGSRLTRRLPMSQSQGPVETMTYDALGNLHSKTDFNGHTITYEYDICCNHLRKKKYQDNTEIVFTYTPTGQRETVTDSNGIWHYEYYPQGWLKRYTYPNGWHIDYDYDDSGNRISLTTHTAGDPQTTSYAFDVLNRLQEVQDPQGLPTSYTYDANSNK